jgi:hypothetical protein
VNNEKDSKVLAIRDERYALVPTNPNIQLLANRLRWRPETAIARIKRSLPALMEQQIYLAIAPQAGESSLLPESMAKLLRLYLGHQHLQLEDLSPGSPGRSRFNSFAEYLGECLNLLKNITKEYSAFSLKIEDAGMIVLQYGKDDPERLIEMVDCNLEEICEVLDINNNLSYSLRMRLAVSIVVNRIIPENHKSGTPDLLDLSDFLNMASAQRHNLRRIFQEELTDYLECSSDEVDRILKQEGIL